MTACTFGYNIVHGIVCSAFGIFFNLFIFEGSSSVVYSAGLWIHSPSTKSTFCSNSDSIHAKRHTALLDWAARPFLQLNSIANTVFVPFYSWQLKLSCCLTEQKAIWMLVSQSVAFQSDSGGQCTSLYSNLHGRDIRSLTGVLGKITISEYT